MDALTLSIPYYRRRGVPLQLRVEQSGSRLKISFPFHKDMVDEVKSMSGARWDKAAKVWSVDHCDRNLLQLLVLSDNPPVWYRRYLEKVNTEAVLAASDAIHPVRKALKPHQRMMLAQSLHQRCLELAADMGTGKTLVAIELLEYVHARWPEATLVYVGRGNPLEASKLEFTKWRCKLSYRPDLLTFITFASLHRFLEQWPAGKPAPRALIVDEGQNIKNASAKQSEAVQHLADAMTRDHGDDCYRLVMTGTPAPKDHVDWWSQIEVVRRGWLRESSAHALRRRLAITEKVDGPYGSYPKHLGWNDREVARFAERIAGIAVRVSRKDVLDLPDPVYEEVWCPPTPEMGRAAQLLAVTANSGLDLLDHLRQLADGIRYTDEGEKRVVTTCDVPKDAALDTLLERYEDAGRFGVYAAYTGSVDKCVARACAAGWDVLRCDGRGFQLYGQRGKPSRYDDCSTALLALQESGEPSDRLCFVGQPGAGGVGLNLQGITGLCYYSNSFNGGDRMQSEARPQRPGNKGLTIFDLMCLPTDRLVLQNLRAKRDAQELVLRDLVTALGELK